MISSRCLTPNSIRNLWLPALIGACLVGSCTVDPDDDSDFATPDSDLDSLDGDLDSALDVPSDLTYDPAPDGLTDGTLDPEMDAEVAPEVIDDLLDEDGSTDDSLKPRFEPDGTGFYRMPWPSDYRRDSDGYVDLGDFPGSGNFMVSTYVTVMEENIQGFSTMPVIYVAFDRDPGAECLPEPAETLEEDSPVQLLDVSTEGCGERIPLDVHFEVEGDQFIIPNVMEAAPVPGFVLAPTRTYALVILRSFGAELDQETSAPAEFEAILSGTADDTALQAAYQPLLDCAGDAGLELADLAVATVFTTQDPVGELRLMRSRVIDAEITAAPEITGWTYSSAGSRNGEYKTYTGFYETPIFQTGQTPYSVSGGGIELDEDGNPVVQRWEEVPFAMTFPLAGTGPHPVLVWEPGTGASLLSYSQSAVTRELVAAGFSLATFQPQFHGTRSGPNADPQIHSFNYINPEAGRTGFRQQVVDTAYFIRVLREALDDQEGLPQLDTTTLVYAGHSQGAIVGGLVAGVETEFAAYALNGLGGYLSITIIERQDPEDINAALQALLGLDEPLDQFHPVVALAQLGADVVDPINYAPHWRGWAGYTSGNHMFVSNGMLDHTTPLRALNAITIAGGLVPIDPPGWDPDPFGVWDVQPATLPIQGNTQSLGETTLTYATQLSETTGHYTIYDRADVRGRFVRFLDSALSGVPVVFDP